MIITCPCNKNVVMKVMNGIVLYEHEDGTGCKILNKFYTDKCSSLAWKMCKRAIKANDHKEFNIYMCKNNSLVLTYLLEYIRFANKSELIEVLKFIFETDKIKTKIRTDVYDMLVSEYGQVAFKNINAIRSKNFAKNEFLGTSAGFIAKFPKSKMYDISSEFRIQENTAKQNMINDLAKSFMIDKAIKSSNLKNKIASLQKTR